MSDILTQIQDEIDFLLNMMHRQLAFIRNNAPPSVPPGQTRVDTFAEVQAKTTTESTQTTQPSQPSQPTITSQPTQPSQPVPVSPEQFNEDIKEFARDIVLKQQQIEALIANLPGLNVSEAQQVERMKVLERELEELEGERVKAGQEREALLRRVEERIGGVGRGR